MKVTAKYGFKIGDLMIPKGTIGFTASLEEVRKIFPNIDYKEGSEFVAAKFFDLGPCIVLKKQLVIG